METTLFTELTLSEEASLSGGSDKKVKIKKIKGAGGGAGSGGVVDGDDSGDATGGDGVFIDVKQ